MTSLREPMPATPSPGTIYRLDPVATFRQKLAFVVMQVVLLVVLLWLSATVLNVFLSQFFSGTTIGIVLVAGGTLAIAWQCTYIYRMLGMQRAVLVDATPPTGLRVAMATTIVPSREFELLRGKLEGMAQVDACGNRLDHWVLDEEDDPRVRAMTAEFNRRGGTRIQHFSRKDVARYSEASAGRWFKRFQVRQKGGNINAWLDATRGEAYDIITFLDLDHVPVAGFYRTVLPYFNDHGVAFVQGPEAFRNRDQNFVTKAASRERDTFVGLVHRSYFGLGMPVIVGSHTTFRADALHDLDGFYPVHLTEDYLLMLHLRALRKRGVFVDAVIAVGELPSTWAAYLQQQLRWASGGLDLLLRYFPMLWRRYTLKELLFTFTLLNYYAWGSFFMLAKLVLFVLLLSGLALRLEMPLIVAIAVFTIVAMFGNHLWERQFYIEPGRKSFLLESALMNNFLGGLYCIALLKALLVPNTAFSVTTKSGARTSAATSMHFYPVAATAVLASEIIGLAVASAWAMDANTSHGGGYDILALPLIISVLGSIVALVVLRRHARATRNTQLTALAVGGLTKIGRLS